MSVAELQRIKDRIAKTICTTWRGDHDGDGNMIECIEGRISADDFMAIFAEIKRLRTQMRDD